MYCMMRSEQEMLDLILNTAREDVRIRAVILNGSRTNPNAARDIFQDFDIVFLVTEIAPFKDDPDWISRFGELMILQIPDDMQDPPPDPGDGFAYLMQFTDGNRLDLTLFPLDKLDTLEEDSLSILLLNKNEIFTHLPRPNESQYLPKPPTAKQFADCCNEFWWASPYVAKGLWREEILYAKHMLDQVMREQLLEMLVWYIGVKTNFEVNTGKFSKHFEKFLEPALWEMLLRSYADADYQKTWVALFEMCALFRQTARVVAKVFDFEYPSGDDEKVSKYLALVQSLPPDAKDYFE